MATTMSPQQPPPHQSGSMDKSNSIPAWGSFLYQNFLLPAFSPSEWLNQQNTPSGGVNIDYFNSQSLPTQSQSSSSSQQPQQHQQQQPPQPQQPQFPSYNLPPRSNSLPYSQPGPSFYNNNYYTQPAIPTSLLQSQQTSSSNSIEVIEKNIISPIASPKKGTKRRAGSLDSNESFGFDDNQLLELHEQDHDIAEGVERDGMIWGMKVEDYRALSARERKRVRNRISARTFRAKRKEHLSSLELDLEAKDNQIKMANDEAKLLRKQVADLRARLSKYEVV